MSVPAPTVPLDALPASPPPSASAANGSGLGALAWIWGPLLLAWGSFVAIYHYYWNLDSHYFYGWMVPVLSAYLVWNNFRQAEGRVARTRPVAPILGLLLLGLAVMFPLRLLGYSIMGWRLLIWFDGALLVSWSLIWVAQHYGWRGLRLALVPLLFLLTAIPWPMTIEPTVIETMTGWVGQFSAEMLRWFGYPAELKGGTIFVGDQSVEVADACSGIRSVQAITMAGIFLGEFGQFRLGARIALLFLANAIAFAMNLMRALALSIMVLSGGQEIYEKWHDPTGGISFFFSWVGLYLLFRLWEQVHPMSKNSALFRAPAANPTDAASEPSAPRLSRLSQLAGVGTLGLLGFSLAAMPLRLDVDVAHTWAEQEGMRFVDELPDDAVVRGILGYDAQRRYNLNWQGKSVNYQIYLWGDAVNIHQVNSHHPAVCMGNIEGLEMEIDRTPFTHEMGEHVLMVDGYRFRESATRRPLVIFRNNVLLPKALWATVPERQELLTAHQMSGHGEFLQVALKRLRDPWAPVLQETHYLLLVGIYGVDDIDAAWAELAPIIEANLSPRTPAE